MSETPGPTRILIASPVHQRPAILAEFLGALAQLDTTGLELSFCFVDDNDDAASSRILEEFARAVPRTTVVRSPYRDSYTCSDVTHEWTTNLVWKVAEFKDALIEHTLECAYDYLFLADSDLVLQPPTIVHLASLQRDIVSEVFWTKWKPELPELPQVWLRDEYDMVPQARGEKLSDAEAEHRLRQVLAQLRTPGLYEVGGLGACTLLSRKALETGCRFREISNLSFWGEDRHFCVRAIVLGFTLHADTHFPPLHLYRESDLERVPAYRRAVGLEDAHAVEELAS